MIASKLRGIAAALMLFGAASGAQAAYSVIYVTDDFPDIAAAQQQQVNASGQRIEYNILYSDGVETLLQMPGIPTGAMSARAINDSGTVAGTYYAPDGGIGIFRYSQGSYNDLGVPQGIEQWHSASMVGLNNAGAIIVDAFGSYNRAGYLSVGSGALTEICSNCSLHDINNNGDIVGYRSWNDPAGLGQQASAISFVNGVQTDLNSQLIAGYNWNVEFANAIDDNGIITAFACRTGTTQCGTVLLDPLGRDTLPPVAAPVPEPETYAMLLAGLGMVGWTARRRQRPKAGAH